MLVFCIRQIIFWKKQASTHVGVHSTKDKLSFPKKNEKKKKINESESTSFTEEIVK